MKKELDVKKCYKVMVKTGKKKYRSVYPEGAYALDFEFGKITRPEIGKIIVFRHYGYAKVFGYRVSNATPIYIVECLALDLNPLDKLLESIYLDDANIVREFWNKKSVKKSLNKYLKDAPAGTYTASAILPYRELLRIPIDIEIQRLKAV